jgi:dihydroorotate dehydrogenase
MISYRALRPAVFLLPPEVAHRAAIRALQTGVVAADYFTHPSLASEIAGMTLSNPVGLAAGFDKNAEAFEGALKAGFGFVEVGTITPKAQPGNPQPRMFRLVEHEAVINRLGFNNEGVESAAKRLRMRGKGVVGGNIGKNKESTDAVADYTSAMRVIYPFVDYITANISSPNTPGLRDLQAGNELSTLVKSLHSLREALIAGNAPRKPIFIKIAPDNDEAAFAAIAQVALAEKVDGLIISNTTIDRDDVMTSRHAAETGGLSGKPLFAKSTHALHRMCVLTQGTIPLIGVGGISSAHDAYQKILAGASTVQLYTGLVYQGFGLVETIKRGLVELLARDGFATIKDAVGKAIQP